MLAHSFLHRIFKLPRVINSVFVMSRLIKQSDSFLTHTVRTALCYSSKMLACMVYVYSQCPCVCEMDVILLF